MVKLRLTRLGKKGQPTYRLIAIQARTKRNGEALEDLGVYNPRIKPSVFEINKERVQYWLGVGAQPTLTVRGLLAKQGIVEPIKKTYDQKPGRKSQERKTKAAAAEAKA
jgi:small subunit ribosomal protein S16